MAVLAYGTASGHAQTADPTATPPSTSSAPAAKAGTYAVSGGNLTAAPGLQVPNGNLPWALDTAPDGKPALVPVHHSAITEPPGVATAPPANHTLAGARAHTAIRSTMPTFFVHTNDRTENTGDAGRGNPTGWVLLPATLNGGNRVVPHIQFSQIAQGTLCAPPTLCLNAETLPDGWARLTPRQALEPGEYVLMPVQHQPKPGVLVVYDFTIDPAAAVARDAVLAGVPAPSRRKR
ncbi:hypothetical protein [Terriglobus aquaticus]|uniref:Uncharacterized protein n=1 Tax=Terriglobus aquaticus TaxID=940139 RepID=A0ABW9KJ12_9BACT|nr:hypothetical protein [Terriglobus aquaticus]